MCISVVFFKFPVLGVHQAKKKKKCKKAKWLSEEALQIAEKRREANDKGDRERYTELNAEFQRTARRDKKGFLNEQCKEIEENNRMGKTGDFFKRIRDIKEIFHIRKGTTKDRKGKDLIEVEEINNRWQEYAEELQKKGLNDQDNYDGYHLEPNILECEVKWALGSITKNKATGSNGILAELFKILEDDAIKVLHEICQQIWKTQLRPRDWKRSDFITNPKKGNTKECSHYCTIVLILHARMVMLKIL